MTAATPSEPIVLAASAVAIGARALAIEGPPGSGKSSLALALIDRGARLIGDDAVRLTREDARILASPPPNIAGLLEVRGVGLVEFEPTKRCPLALVLTLGAGHGERLPETVPHRTILGVDIPCLAFETGTMAAAIRAELALATHGLEVE